MKSEVFYLTIMYFTMLGWWKLTGFEIPFEYIMGCGVISGWLYIGVKKIFNDFRED